MTSLPNYLDEQTLLSGLRRSLTEATMKFGELDSKGLRVSTLADDDTPLAVIGAEAVVMPQTTFTDNVWLHGRVLVQHGMSVARSLHAFRNLMQVWPPDLPWCGYSLYTQRQLEEVLGPMFGRLVAHALSSTNQQPILRALLKREFPIRVTHTHGVKVVGLYSGCTSFGRIPELVSYAEAHDQVLKSCGYTLPPHTILDPTTESYEDILQAGQALWEANGYLDGD